MSYHVIRRAGRTTLVLRYHYQDTRYGLHRGSGTVEVNVPSGTDPRAVARLLVALIASHEEG